MLSRPPVSCRALGGPHIGVIEGSLRGGNVANSFYFLLHTAGPAALLGAGERWPFYFC